jgi:hypothetical protein
MSVGIVHKMTFIAVNMRDYMRFIDIFLSFN